FPEVRDHSAEVEEAVMKDGAYRLSLRDHPPRRALLDRQKLPVRGVLVRQRVWEQTATLLGYGGDRPGLLLLPEITLRGALNVEVAGIFHPVTLCQLSSDLDPTPCIAARDVTIDNPLVYLDEKGAFHFVESIPMREAVNLAQGAAL